MWEAVDGRPFRKEYPGRKHRKEGWGLLNLSHSDSGKEVGPPKARYYLSSWRGLNTMKSGAPHLVGGDGTSIERRG